MTWWAIVILTLLVVWFAVSIWLADFSWFALVGLIVFGVVSCDQSEANQERKRQYEARLAAEKVPRVITEKDGCKVYAFKAGDRWHYFTRCPSGTTTEGTYTTTKRSGKTTTTETHSESIVTENAP